jgi:hypothetical protein
MKILIKESSIRDTRNERYFNIISDELNKMVNLNWQSITQPGNYAMLISMDFNNDDFKFGYDVGKLNEFFQVIGFRYENFNATLIYE